jgi:hypothetical protein
MNDKVLRKAGNALIRHLVPDGDENKQVLVEEVDSWGTEAPIHIAPKCSVVQFQLQDGPIGEAGMNGCQIDDVIMFAREVMKGFNEEFPCDENRFTIRNLGDALEHLRARREDREKRGVEGKDEL